MKVPRKLAVAALMLGSMLASGKASFAQSFYWDSASTSSQGLGGAYVPSTADPLGALSANPAGLTYLSGRTLDMSVSTIFSRGSFSNSANSDSPMTTSPGVVPYGAFGMPIGHSRFSFGVGFAPDLASVSDWHYVDAPGVAGASYGAQEEKSAILSGRSMAGVGINLGPRLSVGATVGADYNSNTLESPYTFQLQPTLAGLKTMLDLHTNGVGWNTSVGVLARPSRRLELGVAWKSHTIINSTGTATGDAYAQFAALGLAGVPSAFAYDAKVRNDIPQSMLVSMAWHANTQWTFVFQTDWVNWKSAFTTLPVDLTNGTNAAINGLLNSTTLVDGVPLSWENQYTFHAGVERVLTESTSIRAGYAHSNNPVPGSTLLPLTAAIMSNQISTGLVYHLGRSRFEAAYSFDPTAQSTVQQSLLLSGEYNNSTVRVGTQALSLNTSIEF